MSLAGDLANAHLTEPHRGPSCTVCRLLLDLPEDEAQALRDALTGPAMTTVIGRIMRDNGHRVANGTLQRHRNGLCRGTA